MVRLILPSKDLYFLSSVIFCGEMAEWLKAIVSKAIMSKGIGGSNPSLSTILRQGFPADAALQLWRAGWLAEPVKEPLMIIQCQASFIVMLPVRQLLLQLNFVPADSKERVGMAFIFSLDTAYDNALGGLSLMERVPEMQLLGITSQWRVVRWMTWLAQGVARELAGSIVTFTQYAVVDEPTRLFINILAKQLLASQLILMPTGPMIACEGDSCFTPYENRLLAYLAMPGCQMGLEQINVLVQAAQSCAVRANYWQAQVIDEKQKEAGCARGHHGLGLVYRFYGNFLAAEYCFEQARKQYRNQGDLHGYIDASYAQTLLHLRFHAAVDRSVLVANECITSSYEWLERESLVFPESEYAGALLDAASGLYQYRKEQFEEALGLCDGIFKRIEPLPTSDRKLYVYVFTLANKARVLRTLNQHLQACALFKEAVQHDPAMSFWWIEYVQSLIDIHDYATARDEVHKALSIHQDCLLLQQLQAKLQGLLGGGTSLVAGQCSDLD